MAHKEGTRVRVKACLDKSHWFEEGTLGTIDSVVTLLKETCYSVVDDKGLQQILVEDEFEVLTDKE